MLDSSTGRSISNMACLITDAVLSDGVKSLVNASDHEGNLATGNESSKADIPQQRRLLQDEATAENEQGGLEEEALASFDVFRDTEANAGEGLSDDYGYDYDDYDESMWGNDTWLETVHEQEADYVSVDSHILCTPVGDSFWVEPCTGGF